jgi:4-hydroxythreonine-4-phosphate dehydrogenase
MKIITTIGDANGIGIEVLIKGIIEFDKNYSASSDIDFYIAGNIKTIKEYMKHFNFPASISDNSLSIQKRICPIVHCESYSPVEFGEETHSSGKLASEAITIAIKFVLENEFDAMVTMPVSKNALYKAGWKYPGHTEMLADSCKVTDPLMILCTEKIRVALATIHIPIKDVPMLITDNQLNKVLNLFLNSLRNDFNITDPKIAVLGLNPHAGEDGNIGTEEEKIIIPAINNFNKLKNIAFGPFPSDGFFAHGEYKNYDGILAMYHDQGLIPLKMLAEGRGVNFTAGLPIIRTSPDHGTAFNIAGKDKAEGFSVFNALKLACEIVKYRKS